MTTPSAPSDTNAILTPCDSRYVMFPIKDNEIWKMYKKQVDCFWRAEEIDFSRDLTDWKTLNKDEKHFISMILAFLQRVMVLCLKIWLDVSWVKYELAEARILWVSNCYGEYSF